MRKLIFLLSVVTVLFAGYTVWVDPQLGPQVRKMLPASFDTASIGTSIRETAANIAPSLTGGGDSGGGGGSTTNYGGIGAANIVAGAVKAKQ